MAATALAVGWSTGLSAQEAEVDVAGSDRAPPVGELLPGDLEATQVKLPELLEVSRTRAPAVERAAARLDRAEARVEGTDVLTIHDPELRAGVERFPFGEFSSGEAQVGVFQRFTIGGEQTTRLEAARARREVADQRLEETRWEVHARVHRLYNLALVDAMRLRLADRVYRFSKDLREIARRRVEAGEASQVAVQVAEAEVGRAKQQFLEARSRLVGRLRKLEEVAGLQREAVPLPEGSLPEVPEQIDADELLEVARESYPPVETREAALEAARARERLEKRRGLPDPGVGLAYKHKSPEAGPSAGGLVAQLSVPLPVWNRNRLERMVSAAEVRVSRTELESLRRELGPKVADAVQALQSAVRRVDIYEERVVPAFERELEMLRKGYRAGEFDITDITVARERLLENRRRGLQARAEYVRAAARVERLTGQEFWDIEIERDDTQGGAP
jgi:cobalt-zinc-cadmium efflux system outer membrane protein